MLILLPILSMIGEYFINMNRLANADELPFILVLIDELYPVWGPVLLGGIFGLLIAIIPVKGLTYSQRLLRSMVMGMLIFNLLFASMYAYLIYQNGLKEIKITKVNRG